MKVLLVDDDYLALEGLQLMLDWEYFNGELVGCAVNGIEALSLIKTTQPDVVISDIKMPEMGGLMLAKHIHQNFQEIHMILLSGYSEFEYAKKALQYGVSDYILKPVTRQKISELNELLFKLHKSLLSKTEIRQLTYDDSLHEKILELLRSSDISALEELMVSEHIYTALLHDTNHTLGSQLLNYLFLYHKEIEKDSIAIANMKQKIMTEYWSLPSHEARIDYITSCYSSLIQHIKNQKSEYELPIVSSCLQLIDKYFTNPTFNISSIADMLHLSLPYLSTVFKHVTNQTLSSYLSQKRLEQAKKLLENISLSIKDVCLNSGYEDPRYFAKTFKKYTKMTPSEYRNLHSSKKNQKIYEKEMKI